MIAHTAGNLFGIDPVIAVVLTVMIFAYLRAVTVLRLRGFKVRRLQLIAFAGAIVALVIALVSPIDRLGEEKLLTAHMIQHLVIADVAAPLLLIGLRSPLILFIWPRPVLVAVMRRRGLRRVFSRLTQPYVAVPVWIVVLYGWHFSVAFEAALEYPIVHALQHQTFLFASILAWWPLIEPARSRLGGQLWKIGQIVGTRMASAFLGMALVLIKTPLYDWYGSGPAEYGLTPIEDQVIAGALMMMVDSAISIGGFVFFFWSASQRSPEEPAGAKALSSSVTTR